MSHYKLIVLNTDPNHRNLWAAIGTERCQVGIRTAGKKLPDGFRYFHENASLQEWDVQYANERGFGTDCFESLEYRHRLLRDFNIIPQRRARVQFVREPS